MIHPPGRRMAGIWYSVRRPMERASIYMIDADGKDIERLTFQGTHNSAPSWSPAS